MEIGRADTDSLVRRMADYMREQWLRWLGLLGFFSLLGVLSGLQVSYFYRKYEDVSLLDVYVWQMIDWYFWIPITPLIWWFARKLPLRRGQSLIAVLRNGAIHLVASVLLSVVHLANSTLIGKLIDAPKYNLQSFEGLLRKLLLGYIHLDILTYFAILVVGLALRYSGEARQSKERESKLQGQLAQARLQALEMQLQPHFLFNTLHAISVLVRKQDSQVALRMLTGLSDLLRATLDKAGGQMVALREELALIGKYLDIEQVRFQDRLTIRTDIAQSVEAARVPSLILQPLAENAIRHGIAPRKEGGTIEVIAQESGQRLHLELRDDGVGLAEEFPEGVGLSNVRARLAQLYPGDHQFSIENRPAGGASAIIDIPLDRPQGRPQDSSPSDNSGARDE